MRILTTLTGLLGLIKATTTLLVLGIGWYGIWGSSGNNVFAVGDGVINNVYHYDGSVWSPMTSGTTTQLNGIWGSSGSDVFVVGSNGTILHYDGSVWAPMTSGTTETALWNLGQFGE